MIEVVEFKPEYAGEWKQFLQASNNGTLFHDLDFLAYHPPSRFTTQHLIFRQDGEIIALLPTAIITAGDNKLFLQSPYGASVGGLVLPLQQSAEITLAVIERLKEYVCSIGLDGVEIRIGPSIYMREPNEHVSFGLMANGFRLVRRWLCHVIALSKNPEDVLRECKRGKARDVRAGLRKGLNPSEVGADRIGDFYRLLMLTQAKHEAVPTHSQEEIEDLFRRVPGRIRLFLCDKDGQVLSGILLFVLNLTAVYTFSICQEESDNRSCATAVLLVHIAQQVASEGFLFLDLGPSTFDDLSLNRGLTFFKEGFGGQGFCRDTWRWERG